MSYRKSSLRSACLGSVAVLSLGLLAACEQNTAEVPAHTAIVDSDAAVEPGENNEIVSDVEDATAGVVGAVTAEFTETTQGFAESVAIHTMFEIAAAEIALGRSTSPEVRAFAEDTLAANKQASDELAAVVAASNIPVEMPVELDARHQGMIDNLTGAAEADFDERFVEQQVNTHNEALTLFQDYAEDGRSPQVRDFAIAETADIQQRLATAEALDESFSEEPAAGAL